MTDPILRVNEGRLWATLEMSAAVGAIEETGLRRLALSDEDREMRDLFVAWANDDGFAVTVDGVGNIFVRADGTDPSAAPVVIGSHLDTQILGGRYDGVLGVLTGLEILRTLRDRGLVTRRPIEVVSWTDEEGARFSRSMMGSSVFAGIFDLDTVLAASDAQGVSFGGELRRIGYAGDAPIGGRRLDAYYELRIEQGPTLDEDGVEVGVVDGSYSVRGMNVEIRGETSHIGPTPMDRRRNALVGAGYLIAAVNDIGLRWHAEDAKTTVSRLDCQPNLYGIVPHRASLTIDYRHADPVRADMIASEIDGAHRRRRSGSRRDHRRRAVAVRRRSVRPGPRRRPPSSCRGRRPALPADEESGRARRLLDRPCRADGNGLYALRRRYHSQHPRGDSARAHLARRERPSERRPRTR